MSKQKWINLVSVYSIIYTVITLLNSVLYLCNGIYEDPSGNWHELDRAIRDRRKFCVNDKKGQYEKQRLSQEWK